MKILFPISIEDIYELRDMEVLVNVLDDNSPSLLLALIPNSEKSMELPSIENSARSTVTLSSNFDIRLLVITIFPSCEKIPVIATSCR